jgi:hypothetical protein
MRPPHRLLQVRTASCAGTACVNSFGDEQLAVDMLADKLLFEALRYSVSRGPAAGQGDHSHVLPPVQPRW